MRIQRPTITQIAEIKGDGAILTGSFSGSFTGEYNTAILSSSGQIADLGAGIISSSDQIDTDLFDIDGLVSGSIQIAGDISGSLGANATLVRSLTAAGVSGSLGANASLIRSLTATGVSGSLGANATLIRSLTATGVSGSLGANAALIRSLDAATISGSNNADSASASTRLTTAESFKTSFDTAIGLSSDDVTILGDLTVSGTTTTVDSTTVEFADNIIALNGTGAANGGIEVNDGPASGSMLWDGTSNYWKAGAKGSENEILTTGNVDTDIKTLSLPASTTISAFGATLVDDADAAAARTTLGVDTAGTDNSTDVTLTGTPDYITISGQVITVGTVDIADDTNFAVSDTTGQTGINLTLTDDTVSGVVVGLDTTNDVQFDSFGVGTAASGTTGEIRATGDITAFYSSDERLKENFAPLTGALDKVKAIGGYEFDWKDGIGEIVSKTGHDIGVKAQELQAQYPELVHERDNGYLAVDYIKLNAVLIEAVKELSAKVDELSK